MRSNRLQVFAQGLQHERRHGQAKTDQVGHGAGVGQGEAGHDEHPALDQSGFLQGPALKACRNGGNARSCRECDLRDRPPIGGGQRLGRPHQQQAQTRRVEDKHEGQQKRGNGVFPALQGGLVRVTAGNGCRRKGRERRGR